MDAIVAHLLPTLQQLGMGGYWVVLLIALLESLAFIGSFVPGATLILFAGFLSAQGYLDIGDLILFAATGAIIGDGISYYLGTKGTRFFRLENKILKLSHIEKGKQFFVKYGNKSIFLGRFIGLLRPIIPFIAGLSKMDSRVFFFWNITSAFAWAASHLLLGYFFGDALKTIEVWFTRGGFFLLAVFLSATLIWFVARKGYPFFSFVRSVLHSIASAIETDPNVRRFAKKHLASINFLKRRFHRGNFSGLSLTFFIIAFAYLLALFFGVIEDLIMSEPIVSADMRIANFLVIFRDKELVTIFTWITALGTWQMITSAALAASSLFWLWKKRVFLIPFWITVFGSGLFVLLGKLVFHRARPDVAMYVEKSFSFPSGHATIAVAFYGFITYIFYRETKSLKQRILLLLVAITMILAIGFSRLYLGVHFFSDVWGGYLLGALWLLIGVALAEWRTERGGQLTAPRITPKIKKLSILLLIAEFAFYIYFASHYHPPLHTQAARSAVVLSGDALSGFRENHLPRFTETLIGEKQEPLSFMIIAKDDASLSRVFARAGWLLADPADPISLLRLGKAASLNENYATAPITPSFWNTQVNDLGFEKPTLAHSVRERHHARFWRTSLVTPEGDRVYVGTASLDVGIKWGITHKIKPDIDTEREILVLDLASANVLVSFNKEQFVDPTLGVNFAGDQFFTDGKLYVLLFR